MSTSDLVTAAVSGSAVLISVVALATTWIGAQRGAFSDLTTLVTALSSKLAAYKRLQDSDEDAKFMASEEIEVSVRQADFLVRQLSRKVPDSICTVVARALETVDDFWRADHYWQLAVDRATDDYYRARNRSLQGEFMFYRAEEEQGTRLMIEAAQDLRLETVDAAIIRGDVYRELSRRVSSVKDASRFLDLAKAEYQKIPNSVRRDQYLGYLNPAQS